MAGRQPYPQWIDAAIASGATTPTADAMPFASASAAPPAGPCRSLSDAATPMPRNEPNAPVTSTAPRLTGKIEVAT